MPYLLRVELPDVPGSLGRVATAIGEAGGDIEAIEIVEHRPDGTAVDDVFLEMAHGIMPDSVVSACNILDGVHVLWVSRYAAGGNVFLDLEVVEQITQNPSTALDELVDLLPVTFRADWAVRLCRTESGVKQVHATSAAPDLGDDQAGWMPLRRAARLPVDDAWHQLAGNVVAGAPLEEDEIIVLGRRGGPDILDSEVARLAAPGRARGDHPAHLTGPSWSSPERGCPFRDYWAEGPELPVAAGTCVPWWARSRKDHRVTATVPVPRTALVVDDDPDLALLCTLHLQGAGYEVLQAYSGAQAIDLALSAPPSVLVLDRMLSDCDGFDVLSTLREDPEDLGHARRHGVGSCL